MNPITFIDGYKLDHRRQYPKGTTRVYSNWTPRSTHVTGQKEVVFFGLQYFLKKYLMEDFKKNFFDQPVAEVVDKYQRRIDGYVGPNQIGTDHIAALHKLGYLPLEFRALPEGTKVPLKVPMFVVENTHPDFFWLVNYIETILSSVLWLPCTSATTAHRMKGMLDAFARDTSSTPEFTQWQGHDFSFRGMAGVEAAALSGAGHLLSFTGTDTIPAIELLEDYYQGTGLIGGSVPATEHSVMSAGGIKGEEDTFQRLLDIYPSGIVSVVSDTWDLWNVLDKILPSLKDKILARDGKLVIRPDSGDPVEIVPRVVKSLYATFGGVTNSKGYKELNPKVGVIYGDGISYDRADKILMGLHSLGFASTNVVFGIGSYTYQYVTRDTYGFAMKATWAEVDGVGRDLWKSPVTDDGNKWSARGRLAVLEVGGKLVVQESEHPDSLLVPVWKDGKFLVSHDLESIRKRLNP